jgi:hypothetical protein
MTLELARKRRDQGDLIHELVEALKKMGSVRYDGLWHASGCHPIGDCPCAPWCIQAVTVLEKAKEHDCIPWDDAREVAQQ